MKPRLVLAAAVLLPAWFLSDLHCASSPATRPARATVPAVPIVAAPAPSRAEPTRAPDLFVSTVRPILIGHCAPCHETGGVMYDRLPFDRAETIASHSAGVLKRIKAPDERAAIERWLESRRE